MQRCIDYMMQRCIIDVMNPSSAITKLMDSGMTEQAIAAAIKVNQTTVNRIRRGVVTPSYDVGKALVDMAVALDQPKRRKRAA